MRLKRYSPCAVRFQKIGLKTMKKAESWNSGSEVEMKRDHSIFTAYEPATSALRQTGKELL
jgi:hypothetical protein